MVVMSNNLCYVLAIRETHSLPGNQITKPMVGGLVGSVILYTCVFILVTEFFWDRLHCVAVLGYEHLVVLECIFDPCICLVSVRPLKFPHPTMKVRPFFAPTLNN